MALNIVTKIDNSQFINEKDTTYKKIKKLPLISLQTNKNFVLIQNRKGKIINKPVFSGYTKNKLSSIPRDVEIILLNKDRDEILLKNDKSFNTSRAKDYIFNNNIYINPYSKNDNLNSVKEKTRSISGHISSYRSDNINNKTIMPFSTNSSKSLSRIKSHKIKKKSTISNITKTPNYWKFYKKVENNNDLSNKKNNLSLDEYQSQFYPGPSDYYGEKSFDKINQQNKYRYKSLFKKEINTKKIKKDDSPGPGSYFKLNNILNNNNKHLSINLGRKEKRFKNLFNNNNPLSPWYYSSLNSNNDKNNKKENNDNNKIVNNKNNNKDFYDYRYYVIKEEKTDAGKKKQFYLEDKTHKIKNNIENNNNTKIIIKPFDNIKYKEKRNFNVLLKKYVNTNDNNKYEVPGPGQYNIYMGFDKMLKNNAIENLKSLSKQEKLIPEDVLKEFSLNKKDPSLLGNESIIDGNNNKKVIGSKSRSSENIFVQEITKNGGGTLPFISRKKRIEFHDDLLLKHTPGPCYYFNDSFSQNNMKNKKLKPIFKNFKYIIN